VNNVLANVVVCFWQNSSCDICSKSKCFGTNSVIREFLALNDMLSVRKENKVHVASQKSIQLGIPARKQLLTGIT
jgi:hypothetical protein